MLDAQTIQEKVQQGKIRPEDAVVLLAKAKQVATVVETVQSPKTRKRKPPRFKVAERSGWCSVYFDNLRRPCTLPSSLWLELLEHIDQFKQFLEDNKTSFKNK